jgi:Fur family ferric uptake transcriptional regulator
MEKKHYNTAGRTRLAQHLKNVAAEPPKSAEELYSGLLSSCRNAGVAAPGRSSVYRMLSEMYDEGEVAKLPAKDGDGFVYQYVGNAHRCHTHFHLHCTVCGRVTHLECKCGDAIAEALSASHQFSVDRGRSVLYGLCAACAKEG